MLRLWFTPMGQQVADLAERATGRRDPGCSCDRGLLRRDVHDFDCPVHGLLAALEARKS